MHPRVALTATATPLVMDEIAQPARAAWTQRRARRLPAAEPGVLRRSICAARRRGSRRCEGRAGGRGAAQPPRAPGRAIVYCSTRKATESVARALRAKGFPATHLPRGSHEARPRARAPGLRRRSQPRARSHQRLRDGRSICADIRLIVHFQAPGKCRGLLPGGGARGARRRAVPLPALLRARPM